MKHLFLIICSTILVAFSACKDKDPANNTNSVSGAQAIIPWQECVLFTDHDITICFVGAFEQRCPCDVQCLVEGYVEATFRATTTSGIDTTFTLTTNSNPINLPNSTTVAGKIITFVNTEGIACADYGNYEKYKVIVRVK